MSAERLTLDFLSEVVFDGKPYRLSKFQKKRIAESYRFLKYFSVNKIIYGINTGFGPMAQYKISEADLKRLQYNLLRSHANGAGNMLPDEHVRAVMTCRLHSLALGYSGVSPALTEQLERFIALRIYPVIYEKGSVGASGDLVQLAHVGLGLIGEGDVRYKGKIQPAKAVLKKLNIKPLELSLRDGLAIINGTSCMTGIAALNVHRAERLVRWQIAASGMINELISAFDDAFSKELNQAKLHNGQREIARQMWQHLSDSKLINKRESWFFTNSAQEHGAVFTKRLQEYYSIRCIPQVLGPIWDAVSAARQLTENEINSASDNPIVDAENDNVYHGGNFHGDYISFEMDKLKIAIAKLSLLAERQLNYLMNPALNEIFPPFLNRQILGLNFGLQGLQFTACSTAAENQSLANSMYVHSIPNNNDNQDIVSMGANSALLAEKVIGNAYTVLSILMIAIAQAVDIAGSQEKLASRSKTLYQAIRGICPPIKDDKPRYAELQRLSAYLKQHDL